MDSTLASWMRELVMPPTTKIRSVHQDASALRLGSQWRATWYRALLRLCTGQQQQQQQQQQPAEAYRPL